MRTSGLLLCVAWLASVGCGGDDSSPPGKVSVGVEDAGEPDPCIDEDGDGFGSNCTRGDDCDDADKAITNQCVLCTQLVVKGCECEPGTKPMSCEPDDIKTTRNGVRGTLTCSEGTRYCRDGVYSDCEALVEYTFTAD